MASRNFTSFSLVQPTTADFVVGYRSDASEEYRTNIQSILNLKPIPSQIQVLFFNQSNSNLSISNANTVSLSSLSQKLSFNESNKNLSISDGNFVSLSSLASDASDLTLIQSQSSNWNSTFTTVRGTSANWNDSFNTTNIYKSASGNFVTNSTLNSVSSVLLPTSTYQNASGNFVTNSTLNSVSSVLLPTSTYQNASSNWQGTYTTVQSNSSTWTSSNFSPELCYITWTPETDFNLPTFTDYNPPFNNVDFNSDSNTFELVNPSSNPAAARVFIKSAGYYEFLFQTLLYDFKTNYDYIFKLFTSSTSTGSFSQVKVMAKKRFGEDVNTPQTSMESFAIIRVSSPGYYAPVLNAAWGGAGPYTDRTYSIANNIPTMSLSIKKLRNL